MYQIKCAICGKDFESNRPHAKYCSPECKKAGRKPILQKLQREYHQREKERRKQQKSEFIGTCKICGRPVRRDSGRLKYCSDECVKIAANLTAKRHYERKHHAADYESKQHTRNVAKALEEIRKKSTLDRDLQALQKDGEKLGLAAYDYGKYAQIKGL